MDEGTSRGGIKRCGNFYVTIIIALVSGPLTNIIAAYPSFKASIGCFDRIQEYLQSEEAVNPRKLDNEPRGPPEESAFEMDTSSASHNFEFQLGKIETKKPTTTITKPKIAIVIQNGSFGADNQSVPVVKDVTLSFQRSKLNVVTGPAGCGKTTLLKALLGETSLLRGSVRIIGGLEASTAYCNQQPWFFNGSVKYNIIGPQEFDPGYFDEVVRACALDTDLGKLPQGGTQSLLVKASH